MPVPATRLTNSGTYYINGFFDEVDGPIVSPGLILNLNAGLPSSYNPATTSTWRDLSSVGNNLTLVNNFAAYDTLNESINFNSVAYAGTASNLLNGLASSSTEFSVSLWFNYTSTASYTAIFEKQAGVGSGIPRMDIGYGSNVFYWTTWYQPTATVNDLNLTTPIIAGTWYHTVLTCTGSTKTAYINGVSVASGAVTSSWPDATQPMGVGGYNRKMNGRVITAQIYNRALTTIEVQQLYNATATRFGYTKLNAAMLAGTKLTTSTLYAVQFDEVSLQSGAITFNGTSQYLQAADAAGFNFGTSNFTVECWFFCTTAPGAGAYATLITQAWPTDSQGIYLGLYGTNQIGWLLGNGTWFFSSTPATTYNTNTWNHLALVRVGTTYTVYLNGSSIDSTTNATALTYSNNALYLGGRTFQYFTGYMSNVRVVKGTAVYTANFTSPQTILPNVSGTSLLLNVTDSTNFIKDNSTNKLTVTNNGSATWTAIGPFNRGSTAIKQRQVSDGTLEVYDKFDEVTGAIDVGGDSTVLLYYDFSQFPSYPGSGSTAYDLSDSTRSRTLLLGASTFSQEFGGALVIPSTVSPSNSGNVTLTTLNTMSVSLWLKITTRTASVQRFISFSGGGEAFILRHDGASSLGQLHMYTTQGGITTSLRINGALSQNVLYNIVGVADGTNINLYLNSVFQGSIARSGNFPAASQNYSLSSASESFVGNMYQITAWNTALTANEVLTNYNLTKRRFGL